MIYMQVLDQVNAAYNDVYGERVGLSANEFLQLDRDDPVQERKYFAARDGIPRLYLLLNLIKLQTNAKIW